MTKNKTVNFFKAIISPVKKKKIQSTIHIIFNYVRAEQDHCLYNITGWRK